MHVGRMRHRLKIERLVESQSGSGAVIQTPRLIATVWAEREPEEGREFFTEEQRAAFGRVVWGIHYLVDGTDEPTPKWRVREGARVHNILDVQPDPKGPGISWFLLTEYRAEDQTT